MPTEENLQWLHTDAEIGRNEFHCTQGNLGSVVCRQKTIIPNSACVLGMWSMWTFLVCFVVHTKLIDQQIKTQIFWVPSI